jgi:precorrin-2 dehydrogenase/sirohydrochlorin ferrochelatase
MGTKNELYPIFLKVSQLNVLIIGGGVVGTEKLHFLLKSSPNANVKIVSKEFSEELLVLAKQYDVELIKESYKEYMLDGKHLIIAATNFRAVNEIIYNAAKARNILVNVADTPDLCDFYLGGIVTKGNVKVAISTNGKSPTMAKRLRQFFEQVIPDNIDDLIGNINSYRAILRDDFQYKVDTLNDLTKSLITNKE